MVLIGSLFLGCAKLDVPLPDNEVPVNEAVFLERDAGVVVEHLLVYDFLVGGGESKEVATIFADCGCTRLSLTHGDIFDYSQPFRVHVQLQGTQWGKGQQDFLIKFSDGTVLDCRLTYVYAPPPYVMPEELLFFEDVSKKEITFFPQMNRT